jgi:hypothetical protein
MTVGPCPNGEKDKERLVLGFKISRQQTNKLVMMKMKMPMKN